MRKIKALAISIVLVIVDQIIKKICVSKLAPVGSIQIIKNFFYLTYVENRGAAFGMFQGGVWIFVIVSIATVVFLIYYYINLKTDKFFILNKIAIVLIISGAIGNMIDRIFRGFVVDMFHFILFSKDFAVFNLADVFVCVGVFLISICIIFAKDSTGNIKEKEKKIG